MIEIRSATGAEEERVVALIALAFAADPFARWLGSDPARYYADVPATTRAFGGRAFEHGTAHVAGDALGAALWLPPGVEPDGELLFERMAATGGPERAAALEGLFAAMEAHHPTAPHWYLPIIAVDPPHQGRGIGAALLAHALARIDADGLPAYLESSNPRNQPLYERHGFEPVGEIRVGDSPPLVPMLRPARR